MTLLPLPEMAVGLVGSITRLANSSSGLNRIFFCISAAPGR